METNQLQLADTQFALSEVGQTIKLFEVQQRIAKMYSTSTIVPETYRGNLGNCVIALDMAQRMKVNPLMVMQNLYVVHGNPAFSSKFLISCINASGRFSALRYEFSGDPGTDGWGCKVVAYEVADRERQHPLEGTLVTIGMAKAEGWMNKAGSKWKTMPEVMLRYRAAAFWQRAYCPEISMGFLTAEEAHEIEDVPYEEIAPKSARRSRLAQVAQAAAAGETPEDTQQTPTASENELNGINDSSANAETAVEPLNNLFDNGAEND